MSLQLATSKSAQAAYGLVKKLQSRLVQSLDELPPPSKSSRFQPINWLRAQGVHGGGTRYVAVDEALFNRASVNISQVQYESDPSKKMGSSSALSTIVHPRHPFAPSMHMHISWTELKSGEGYWRIMGDLNPSTPQAPDTQAFDKALQEVCGALYQKGKDQGEQYFFIPALGRHRGVAHFYLEDYRSANLQADFDFAEAFGLKVIQSYAAIVKQNLLEARPVVAADWQRQLHYHSLYFLQVLTLDRGTTSGLLVHDENDTGILGSLPSHVDKALLSSWLPKLPKLQQTLLKMIIDTLPQGETSLVDDGVKVKIAQVSREFYRLHPETQDLLAQGFTIPPTQENHR